MNDKYILPIDLSLLKDKSIDITIDMSKFNFPCDESSYRRASFIFIRNTGLKAKFDFSNCTFDEKEDFLTMYMDGPIITNIPELTETWINIIAYKYAIVKCNSILATEEIEEFIDENILLVTELRKIVNSIPLCSIDYFSKHNKSKIYDIDTVNDIPINKFSNLNFSNFVNMCDYDDLARIIGMLPLDEYPIQRYVNIFNANRDNLYGKLIKSMPYLAVLDIICEDPEKIDDRITKVANNIKQILHIE